MSYDFRIMRSLIYVGLAKEEYRPKLENWLYKHHVPESISKLQPYITKYAFYQAQSQSVISKGKRIEILNEKDELVKDGEITKDINYIFYTSKDLNEKYKFNLIDKNTGVKSTLEMTFGDPIEGQDDLDKIFNK